MCLNFDDDFHNLNIVGLRNQKMKDHSIVFSKIWLLQWIIGGHRLLISTSFVCRRRYARAGSFNGFNGFSRFNGFSSVLIVPMVSRRFLADVDCSLGFTGFQEWSGGKFNCGGQEPSGIAS